MKKKKFWMSLMALLLAVATVFGSFAMAAPVNVNAASSSEIRDEIDALEEQQAAIRKRSMF